MAAKLRAGAGSLWGQGLLALAILGVAACAALILPTGANANPDTPPASSCIQVGYTDYLGDSSIQTPANNFFAAAVDLTPALEHCAVVDNRNDADSSPNVFTDSEAGEIVSQAQTLSNPLSPAASGQTVWYRWTAPNGRSEIFDTFGTEISNAILTVYQSAVPNPSLGDLSFVGDSSVITQDPQSANSAHMWRCKQEVRYACFELLNPDPGRTYYIQVDSEVDTGGVIQLNWRQVPVPPALPHFAVLGSPDLDGATSPPTSMRSMPRFYFRDGSTTPYANPVFNCTLTGPVSDAKSGSLCQGTTSAGDPPPVSDPHYTAPFLTNGTYQFRVDLSDGDTGLAGEPSTITFSVQAAPPSTPTITSGPNQPLSNSSSATFSYHDGPTATSFVCSLDNANDASFTLCSIPFGTQSYSNLADGPHTFYVKAVNNSGRSAAASYSWTIATSKPTASPVASPAANAFGWNNSDVTVDWHWSAAAGIDPSNCTTSTVSSGQGTIDLSASCTDKAGNTGTAHYTVNVDKSAPVADPSQSPQPQNGWNKTDVTVDWHWTDTGGSGLSNCVQSSVSAGAGDITLATVCSDAAGNSSTSTYTVHIDKTAPAVVAVATANGSPYTPGAWTNQSVVVAFICTDAGGSGVDTVSPAQTFSASGSNLSATGTCTDRAGNTASATFAPINIDKTAPTVTITGQPPASTDSPDGGVTFTPSETPVTYTCTLDGQPVACDGGSASFTGLGIGLHTFTVYATDQAGNTGPTKSVTWEIIAGAGCNMVADVHGNANFSTTVGSKKATVHVEVEADCDQIKAHDDDDDERMVSDRVIRDGIYLHHSRVKVELSGSGDNKLIDAKQMSNNSKYQDIKNVQLTATPAGATIRGTYKGTTFVVTLVDGGKGKGATDSVQVSYPGFPTGTLTAPHQDVHIEWH